MKLYNYILILAFLVGCQTYETDEYYHEEEAAIQDLIPQVTDLENMLDMNDYGDSLPTLYLMSHLDNDIYVYNHDRYEDSEEQNVIEEEKEVFKPLLEGELKVRILNETFLYDQIQVVLTEHNNDADLDLSYSITHDSTVFGYLYFSRIIFNKDYTVGYLGYSFFCGSACAWNNNIQIQKRDGKWVVTKHYSGGIA